MKQVSQDWQNAIYAQTRETKALIQFSFVDPEAKASAQFNTLPTQSAISRVNQMIDDNPIGVGKVAEFEPNYWKLDGSFILPKVDSGSSYGFRGYALSDENCEFHKDNVLRFFFTQPITTPGFMITFDTDTDQYLTDFDIVSYNENLEVIRRVEIRDNTDSTCVTEYGSENIKYLDIVFLKTNHPHRSVRMLEIDFGIALIFEGKNLFTVQLTSESDYLTESIPHNELVFSAENNGRYDYTNPEAASKYLQQKQEFKYTHKVKLPNGEYETVDMGKYLLNTWKVSDQKVEFTARADMYKLEETVYSRNSLTESISAGAFLERIFEECGVDEYVIPDFTYESPMVTPYVGENCLGIEALRQVASMCGCAVYRTPDGVTVVHKVDFENEPTDEITYDNEFSSPNSSSTPYYNAIQLTVYKQEGDSMSSVTEIYTAPWYQGGESIYAYALDLKMCIDDNNWVALRPWILEQKFRVLNFRLYAEIDWRQNPAQDVGDYVNVQLDKSGGTSKVFIQKQVLNYRGGALRGNSVGIGKGQ